jgi:hypothetical protein
MVYFEQKTIKKIHKNYRQTEDYREAVINAYLQGAITARQQEELLHNVINNTHHAS